MVLTEDFALSRSHYDKNAIDVHQAAVQPPSILRLWPVTIAEAG